MNALPRSGHPPSPDVAPRTQRHWEFGPDAHRFLDVLAETPASPLWQVLPLGPTGYGDSPYQTFSAFAGNPLLIAVEGDGRVFPAHYRRLRDASSRTSATLLDRAIAPFKPDDQFRDVRRGTGVRGSTTTRCSWRSRRRTAARPGRRGSAAPRLASPTRSRAGASSSRRTIRALSHRAVPVLLAVRRARKRAPPSAAFASWATCPSTSPTTPPTSGPIASSFKLDADGTPARAGRRAARLLQRHRPALGQSRSTTGTRCSADGYAGGSDGCARRSSSFDLVRIDHFRGFEAYWEVPGDATTAVDGRWVEGPGRRALRGASPAALGPLPIVAENLGVITPAVEALREQFGYPGHEHPAVRLRHRPASRRIPAAQLPARARRLHGHARQRHDGGMVESTGEGDSTRARRRRGAREGLRATVSRRRWPRDALDAHPRGARVRREHRDRSRCRTCWGSAARHA